MTELQTDDHFLVAATRATAVSTESDASFPTPQPTDGSTETRFDTAPVLRAREDVELLLTKAETDRLVALAVAAAEASPHWGPSREFIYEVTDDDHVFDGFERSSFTVSHQGTVYDVRYYDGFSTEFIQ
jgi:hypothetical protein